MINYSIIIPVYNGEQTIEELVYQIIAYFNKTSYSFQIILVYDWGKDNSWDKLKLLKNKYPKIVKVIKLTKNFGQHNALIAGVKHSDGQFIITMDEDLQHNPFDIEKLILKQKENDYDIVYGKAIKLKHSFFRNITSKILKKILKFSIPELHPDYSAFRLIKTSIAKETLQMNNSYTFIDGYLSWITTNVSSIEISHNERAGGTSAYNTRKLINHSVNIFVTFSNMPIRMLTYSSVLILIISAIFSVYLVVRKIIFNDIVAGYTSFMVVLGFGIGLILFSLGIIGEYIYRINLKTTKRPNFIEKEIL